jgi:hypothetical protein
MILRRTVVRDAEQQASLFGHGVIANEESSLVVDESGVGVPLR